LVIKPEGKKHLEDLGIDGRVILKFFLKMEWINLAYERDEWGAVVECGNVGSEFFDRLRKQLFKQYSALWNK